MLNVCDPCLIVITRWPRLTSSATRRTTSVVFPLCFRPMMDSIGGVSLGERKVIGRVHVHEKDGGIAKASYLALRQPLDAHIVEEGDDAHVVRLEAPLDRRDARRRIICAQRLESAPRSALGEHGIGARSSIAQASQQCGRNE